MRKVGCALLLMLLMITFVACGTSKTTEIPSLTLEELYPGDITNVDSIEIMHGSGERKVFSNRDQVQEWLSQVKHERFEPDPNQEGSVGFLYRVTLHEGQEKKLGFTTNSLGGRYYMYNEELKIKIQKLYESGE